MKEDKEIRSDLPSERFDIKDRFKNFMSLAYPDVSPDSPQYRIMGNAWDFLLKERQLLLEHVATLEAALREARDWCQKAHNTDFHAAHWELSPPPFDTIDAALSDRWSIRRVDMDQLRKFMEYKNSKPKEE